MKLNILILKWSIYILGFHLKWGIFIPGAKPQDPWGFLVPWILCVIAGGIGKHLGRGADTDHMENIADGAPGPRLPSKPG